MAFTVETGAGVAGANSYVSVADCDTYHSDRGNSTWTGTTAVKQAALIKATDYLTQLYGGLWLGERVTLIGQALDWPRVGFYEYDTDEIPDILKQAVCILALEALSTDLNPVLARGGSIKRQKVDVIETEYMDGASSRTTRPAIDGILRPLIKGSPTGFMAKSVRI